MQRLHGGMSGLRYKRGIADYFYPYVRKLSVTKNKETQELTPKIPQNPQSLLRKAVKLRLTGKHAVGRNAFAIVDADMFDELNLFRWKAKPNAAGTHVYAVRNTSSKTIRLQQVVAGDPPSPGLVVECVSKNTLDYRRENLRWVTKSQNAMKAVEPASRHRKYLCIPHTCRVVFGVCMNCGGNYRMFKVTQKYCSDSCRYQMKTKLRKISCCLTGGQGPS